MSLQTYQEVALFLFLMPLENKLPKLNIVNRPFDLRRESVPFVYIANRLKGETQTL